MKATVFVLSQGGHIKPGFYMSDDQIKTISQSPLISVECHTLDHADLKGRTESFQRNEIFGCKQQLETLIGKPVLHFAYPYGDFDQTTVKLVQEAGYETASTTTPGAKHILDNIFTLRRIRVGNYGGNYLKILLSKYN